MTLEVELLHRIESLEARVKACEEHHHDGEYHEHLLDEEEIKSILDSHSAEAAKEIEKKEESKEEESPESEPAGQESSSSDSKEEEKEEKQKEEVPPKREHFLHKKVGGKRSH